MLRVKIIVHAASCMGHNNNIIRGNNDFNKQV